MHQKQAFVLKGERAVPSCTPKEFQFIGRFTASDGGFTTAGVAIALLLVLALLFTASQVRWVTSTSADIQFVADSGALAAQNIVAEYEVIAQVADAVVLSLSLFGLVVYGIAIVVSCIPFCQAIGEALLNFGNQIFEARNTVAQQAMRMLDALQRALPFLCAANAARVISGNHIAPNGAEQYLGLAIPLPLTGKAAEFPSDESQEYRDDMRDANENTAELTDEAQEAYERMEEAKLEGYMADCGNNPNYCMYERARGLANLSGTQNPYFSSVDTWLFDYAFARACAYYPARLAIECPATSALDEHVRSFARTRFYALAVTEIPKGHAHTSPDGTLDAHFPLLPRNTSETKETRLYTEQVYPVCAEGIIHGCYACPEYQSAGAGGLGSAQQLDNGTYGSCETCDFSATTIGKVAQASTSINNGFEYWYRRVAEAAEDYRQAAEDYNNYSSEAQKSAQESFDIFEEALAALKVPRIDPRPPGRNGCIAIVIDPSAHAMPAPFSSSLVGGNASLQPRLAISAAAMANDKASHDENLLASFLDRVKDEADLSTAGGIGLGVFDKILSLWGSALLAYGEGTEGFARVVGDFLRSIPLVGSTPLGSWAEQTLVEMFEALGLQPARLSTPKPVLVNTLHVSLASDSAAARALISAKQGYASLPGSGSGGFGTSLVDGLLGELEAQGDAFLESEFTLFTISFGDNPSLPQIPIKISLPEWLVDKGKAALSDARSSLGAVVGGGGNNAIWE
ncbi:MAG: hypothetical protein LBB42_04670 [Coriobacteriales bacterium]|jgi:hypothetical protein|nr:hypothetical protein [Coriobacteriales bacterium]